MAKTPHRTIRVSDELWQAAQKQAAHDQRDLTSVIVEHLHHYAYQRDELRTRESGMSCGTCGADMWWVRKHSCHFCANCGGTYDDTLDRVTFSDETIREIRALLNVP